MGIKERIRELNEKKALSGMPSVCFSENDVEQIAQRVTQSRLGQTVIIVPVPSRYSIHIRNLSQTWLNGLVHYPLQ